MVSWPKNLKFFKLGWKVFTWNTCMSSAWLQSMFMHGRVPASLRPGTRDDKTQPNLAPPLPQRTIWRSRISKSKSDLVAHNSGFWGVRLLHDVLALFFRWRCKTFGLVVLLPFKQRLFREPICKIVYFEQCVCWESDQCVSQDMILPKYCFATISFCQNIVLPQYHFAKIWFCQSIMLPKYCFAKMYFPKILWCQMIKAESCQISVCHNLLAKWWAEKFAK